MRCLLTIITKRVCLHPHARDDGKLISTSSEGPPEIGILISSGIESSAVG